jgi:hypothetical protein
MLEPLLGGITQRYISKLQEDGINRKLSEKINSDRSKTAALMLKECESNNPGRLGGA